MSDRCIKRKYLNCKPKTCARNMHYIKSITELFSLHCTPLLISLKETYKCRAEWFFSGLAQVDSSYSAHINFHSHVLLMGLCKQGLVGQEIIIILLLYTCILLVVHFLLLTLIVLFSAWYTWVSGNRKTLKASFKPEMCIKTNDSL